MNIVKDKIWESLTITNDFIFAKVMENEGICKKVLEVLLNMEVGHVAYVENEKTIAFGLSSKGVRLDVFVKDEDTLHNIEMQVTNNKDLGKRSRYYQVCIDLHSLEKGVTYKQMKKSYIVFICAFDPFQENMAKYEFRNYCIDNKDIELEDGAVRVFFHAKAYKKEEDEDRRAFLKYINGEKTNNKFIEELEEIVEGIKNNRKWRKEYMNMYMRELELKEESYEKGMQIGVQTGIQQGIQQ